MCPTRSLSLSQTPGPTAFPKIEVDTYKRRAPIYTMGAQTKLGGDRTVKPGPADYRTGKVGQPAHLSCCVLQQAALKHLPLQLGLCRTSRFLAAGTSCRTAGLLPARAPGPSRGRAENTSFPFHSPRPYMGFVRPSQALAGNRAEKEQPPSKNQEGCSLPLPYPCCQLLALNGKKWQAGRASGHFPCSVTQEVLKEHATRAGRGS